MRNGASGYLKNVQRGFGNLQTILKDNKIGSVATYIATLPFIM